MGRFRNWDFEDSLVWNDSGSAPDTDFSSLQYAQVDTTKACPSHFTQPVALLITSPGNLLQGTRVLQTCIIACRCSLFPSIIIDTFSLSNSQISPTRTVYSSSGALDLMTISFVQMAPTPLVTFDSQYLRPVVVVVREENIHSGVVNG
jgi:hypothetical protein